MAHVALYARCSTKKQELDSQIRELVDWAEKNKHTYVLFQDMAVSGKQNSRKGINECLARIKAGEFKLLGVVELSRIGRSIGFIHSTISDLSDIGVKVVLTKNNTTLDYKSLEGRALIGGLALASDIEWMLIQERNQRGRDTIREKGIKLGRKEKPVSIEALKALMTAHPEWGYRRLAMEFQTSPAKICRVLKPKPVL
jgi:DNA invertase Pin-like site-specific DNA recombinase